MSNKLEWYVVQVYANSELAAKNNILGIQENQKRFLNIKDIFVPIQEVVSISPKGKKTVLEKALYQGYIYIQIENYKSIDMTGFNSISKVSQLLGKISDKEIEKLKAKIEENKGKIKYNTNLEIGDNIIVKSGSFSNFKGVIEKLNYEDNEVVVSVDVFSRKTNVTLNIHEIELNLGDN